MQQIKVMSLIVVAALLLSTAVYASEFSHSSKAATKVTARDASAGTATTFKLLTISSKNPLVGDYFKIEYSLMTSDGSGVAAAHVQLYLKQPVVGHDMCSCGVDGNMIDSWGDKCPPEPAPIVGTTYKDVVAEQGATDKYGIVTFTPYLKEDGRYQFYAKFESVYPLEGCQSDMTEVNVGLWAVELVPKPDYHNFDGGLLTTLPRCPHNPHFAYATNGQQTDFVGQIVKYRPDDPSRRAPLRDATVELYSDFGVSKSGYARVASTTTDENGHFTFNHVPIVSTDTGYTPTGCEGIVLFNVRIPNQQEHSSSNLYGPPQVRCDSWMTDMIQIVCPGWPGPNNTC